MAKNLKIGVGVETSEVKKGFSDVTKQVRSFGKEIAGQFGDVGKQFGALAGALRQIGSAFSSSSAQVRGMSEGMSTVARVGKVAAGTLGLAVASVGVAWREISNDVKYYENTVNGAVTSSGWKAFRDTWKEVRASAGEGSKWAEIFNSIKGGWAELSGRLKLWLTGASDEYVKAAEDITEAAGQTGMAIRQKEIEQKKLRREIADIDAEIARRRELMAGIDNSSLTKMKAMDGLEGLIVQKYAKQIEIARQLYDLQEGLNQQKVGAGIELQLGDISQATDYYVAWKNLIAQRDNELRAIQRQRKKTLKEWQSDLKSALAGFFKSEKSDTTEFEKNIDLKIRVDAREIQTEAQNAVDGLYFEELEIPPIVPDVEIDGEMLKQGLADIATSFAESIGTLFADLINGENPFENFGMDMLKSLGGFAVKFGSLLMSMAVATLELHGLFKNPIAALAAGAALVTMGALMSGLASNFHSTYSAGSSYSSSYGSGGGSGSELSEQRISIEVTGTLQASGSTLQAVLDNEARRKYLTT